MIRHLHIYSDLHILYYAVKSSMYLYRENKSNVYYRENGYNK